MIWQVQGQNDDLHTIYDGTSCMYLALHSTVYGTNIHYVMQIYWFPWTTLLYTTLRTVPTSTINYIGSNSTCSPSRRIHKPTWNTVDSAEQFQGPTGKPKISNGRVPEWKTDSVSIMAYPAPLSPTLVSNGLEDLYKRKRYVPPHHTYLVLVFIKPSSFVSRFKGWRIGYVSFWSRRRFGRLESPQ